VVWRQGKEWTSVLRSGRREPDRCYQGRMRRYPARLASGPGLSQQGAQRLRQRIGRSIVFQFICKDRQMRTRGLTKKRMPSASFCQRSTILLSSSSAALEYMEKSGPELSPKLDSPPDGCDGLFRVDQVWSLSFLHTFVNFGENGSKWCTRWFTIRTT
jgi:hypothetical protein